MEKIPKDNSKIIINKNAEFKTSLNLDDFCYRGENFIKSLLHSANAENDNISNEFSEGPVNQLLTILCDFKQQQVAPGTVVVYSKSRFFDELTQYAKQNAEVDAVFKEKNLYDPEYLFQSMSSVLYFLDVLPIIDACSGIAIKQNSVIMYRDMRPDPEDPYLSQLEIDEDYEYDDTEDERFWLWDDFDNAIKKFVTDTTKDWITVMSEEEFFEKFKEYVKLASNSNDLYYEADFDYFMDSITSFYSQICDYRGFINRWTPLYWSIGSGYVVLINDDLNSVK